MPTMSPTRLWVDHFQDGVLYKLKHLYPAFVDFSAEAQPAAPGRAGKPARRFRVRIEYSNHCFSIKSDTAAPGYNPDHLYIWEKRKDDLRVFCPTRYADSLMLPHLVESLHQRNVYPTRKHNHFAVKRASPEGHYSIWFRVERERNYLRLVVESAYVRLDMDQQIARATPTKLMDVLVHATEG